MPTEEDKEYFHLTVDKVTRVSGSAIQFKSVQTGIAPVWIPKSVVAEPEKYKEGDTNVTLSIEQWFAEKNELTQGELKS